MRTARMTCLCRGFLLFLLCAGGCREDARQRGDGNALNDLLAKHALEDVVIAGPHEDTLLFARNGLRIWYRKATVWKNRVVRSGFSPAAIYVFGTEMEPVVLPVMPHQPPYHPQVFWWRDGTVMLMSYKALPLLAEHGMPVYQARVHMVGETECARVFEQEFEPIAYEASATITNKTYFQLLSDLAGRKALLRMVVTHDTRESEYRRARCDQALIWQATDRSFAPLEVVSPK